MSEFVFTETARQAMVAGWDYIAQDNLDAADRFRATLYEAVQRLVALPGMGHRRDDLANETLRVWPVSDYLVIYRPETDPLEIVRVVSGYRNIAGLLMG